MKNNYNKSRQLILDNLFVHLPDFFFWASFIFLRYCIWLKLTSVSSFLISITSFNFLLPSHCFRCTSFSHCSNVSGNLMISLGTSCLVVMAEPSLKTIFTGYCRQYSFAPRLMRHICDRFECKYKFCWEINKREALRRWNFEKKPTEDILKMKTKTTKI